MSFLSVKTQHSSSITAYPLLSSQILSSVTDINLSDTYSPDHTFDIFLKEISKKQVRKEAFEYSLSEYRGPHCEKSLITEPSVSVYKKVDRSFPMMDDIVVVKIIGTCSDFVLYHSNMLPKYINSVLVKNIEDIENNLVKKKYNKLLSRYNRDVQDVKAYISSRKDVLRNFIDLEKNRKDGQYSTGKNDIPQLELIQERVLQNLYHVQLRINTNENNNQGKFITTLSSYEAARTELDYLQSISSIEKASIGLINQLSIANNYNIDHSFQNAKLFNFSRAKGTDVEPKSTYLHIFSIVAILSLGMLYIALLRIRNSKD